MAARGLPCSRSRLGTKPPLGSCTGADYFASGPQHDGELLPALERARAGGKRVIPILVRPFDRHATVLAGLTVLPTKGGAVTEWSNRDAAWAHVVAEIRKLIGALSGVATRGPRPEPAYENDEIRALAGRLERARARRAALQKGGQDTAGVDAEILDLRRKLREGGQLRAGDALADGRYQLLRSIGRGGFASVWEALDQQTGARVAVKVLHPELAREPSSRERFFRGARIMADLQHSAVVRVLATDGGDGGYLFFVMELIDGEDLHHAVMGGRLPRERMASVILRVGEALAEAHAKGIIHRDVKPQNHRREGLPQLAGGSGASPGGSGAWNGGSGARFFSRVLPPDPPPRAPDPRRRALGRRRREPRRGTAESAPAIRDGDRRMRAREASRRANARTELRRDKRWARLPAVARGGTT